MPAVAYALSYSACAHDEVVAVIQHSFIGMECTPVVLETYASKFCHICNTWLAPYFPSRRFSPGSCELVFLSNSPAQLSPAFHRHRDQPVSLSLQSQDITR